MRVCGFVSLGIAPNVLYQDLIPWPTWWRLGINLINLGPDPVTLSLDHHFSEIGWSKLGYLHIAHGLLWMLIRWLTWSWSLWCSQSYPWECCRKIIIFHLKNQDVEWYWWYLLSIMNNHDITTGQRWCPVSIDQYLTSRQEARRLRVLKGMGMFNLFDTNDILVSMSVFLRRTISQCRSRLGHVCCCHSSSMIWVTLHSVTLHPTVQKHDRHTSCHHFSKFEDSIEAYVWKLYFSALRWYKYEWQDTVSKRYRMRDRRLTQLNVTWLQNFPLRRQIFDTCPFSCQRVNI